MTNGFAPWVDLAWFPISLVLVGTLGARKAAPFAILAGYLFLPPYANWGFLGPLLFEKRTIVGPAFLIAAMAFDARTWLRARPSWLDLPMALFTAGPLVVLAWHRLDQTSAAVCQAWINLTEWAVPYAIARVYCGDREGTRRLAGAIVVGGLACIPICWYETIAGPEHYLSGLIYGTNFSGGMVNRLGGYRPEGLIGNGIELATWMALATIMAAWLCGPSPARRPFDLPRWAMVVAAVALGATTVACRGVFGYLAMALGLATAATTLALKSKWPLALLMLVPPAYVTARAGGLWSGEPLRQFAGRAGNEGTIRMRLESEDRFVGEVTARDPAFGFGGEVPYWVAMVDSWWAVELHAGGAFGLLAWLGAFLAAPALAAYRPERRLPARSVEAGLALLALVAMIHNLLNTSIYPILPMISGALVTSLLAGPATEAPTASGPRAKSPGRRVPVALVATVIVLAILEVLGRLPRSNRVEPQPPKAEAKP